MRAERSVVVWTSSLKRTVATAELIGRKSIAWRALDELDAGICDGLTYAEIATRHSEEFQSRARDKFRYRYPRGESYADVILRLEPLIIELERTARQRAGRRASGGRTCALRLSDGKTAGRVPAHPGAAAYGDRAHPDRVRLRGAARGARAGRLSGAGFVVSWLTAVSRTALVGTRSVQAVRSPRSRIRTE